MIGWFIFGVIIIDEETIMDIVGAMLKYMEVKDKRILVKNIQISDYELTVVVKILSWLKLEHKRSIWISQGKRNRFKPLEIDMRYPWCANLYKLVENESLFVKRLL